MRPVSTEMQQRIARNEATLGQINEDIGRGRAAEDDSTLVGFIREWGHMDCSLIGMAVVEKSGASSAIAEATDPRR